MRRLQAKSDVGSMSLQVACPHCAGGWSRLIAARKTVSVLLRGLRPCGLAAEVQQALDQFREDGRQIFQALEWSRSNGFDAPDIDQFLSSIRLLAGALDVSAAEAADALRNLAAAISDAVTEIESLAALRNTGVEIRSAFACEEVSLKG